MGFKRPFALVLSLLLLAGLLSGCNLLSGRKSDAEDAVSITWKVHNEAIKDEDGTKLLDMKITYPEIDNPENKEGIAKINEYFKNQFDDFLSRIMSEGVKTAKEDRKAKESAGYDFYPHWYYLSSTVEYNANGLLSVLSEYQEYTGGAHPTTTWTAGTFNVSDGRKLELTDVLGGTEEEALQKVYSVVKEQIKAVEGTNDFVYFDDWEEGIVKYYNKNDFFLSPKSIKFFYQLYTIAPYAAGIRIFELPYDKAGKLPIDVREIKVSEYEKEVYEAVGRLIDNNLKAFRDIFGLHMLPMDIPENRPEDQVFFPVVDDEFVSFVQLEQFVRNTYVKKEADSLLGSGKYKDVDGKLHGDITKDGGMGYYVNWNDYRYEIKNIRKDSADLVIYVVDDSPAGKEDVTIEVKLLKENDKWLLERMFM